ncbi:hypothetical protein N204_07135 [Helicobacter pylori UM085]|nr:hypothetical protein N204_07135 [Helicobacter pylori UM085]
MLCKSKEVSKKPFFNGDHKKAHLVRSFHSLMVFEKAFF